MKPVSQAEFARLEGVNRSTVNRWIRSGRVTADSRGMIDPEEGRRLRTATESPLPHHQARKAQIDEGKGNGIGEGSSAAPAASGEVGFDDPAAPASMETLGHLLRQATVDLQRNKAELTALEVDRVAGALVQRADVDFVLVDFGATLRGLLEGMPDRLAGEIAAHQGNVNAIHKSLEDVARELLQSMSAQMERRLEGIGP
jgi:phage terminase Nu1 subunit (DNA packaging protein)